MVQPLVNVWIGTLIGSSLASVIGIQDVTAIGQSLNNSYAGGLGGVRLDRGGLCGDRAAVRRRRRLDRASGGGAAVSVSASGGAAGEPATRVLFDEPGPRARRRIRIAYRAVAAGDRRGASTVADRPVRRQRAAGRGEMEACFTAALVRSFLWDGLLNTMKLTVVSGVHRVAARRVCSRCCGWRTTGSALARDRLRRGLPLGAVAVAGADVRAGAAAARASTCRSSGRSASRS